MENAIGLKLKDTGSLTNWLMAGGTTGHPKTGEGATVFSWTDRHAYTVIAVSADGKSCSIQEDNATRTDTNGMSDSQSYEYTPNPDGAIINLAFKWGAWRKVPNTVYRKGTEYPKISIKFGVRDKYHDYSF